MKAPLVWLSDVASPRQGMLMDLAADGVPPAAAGPSGEGPGVAQVFVDAALFYAPAEVLEAQSAGSGVRRTWRGS